MKKKSKWVFASSLRESTVSDRNTSQLVTGGEGSKMGGKMWGTCLKESITVGKSGGKRETLVI